MATPDVLRLTSQFLAEALEDAVAVDRSPVDVEHPGFLSLWTALQGHHQGVVPRWVLEVYAHQLGKQVGAFRDQLANLKVPEEHRGKGGPIQQAMNEWLDHVQSITDSLNSYVESGETNSLDQAFEATSGLMKRWPSFATQLRDEIEQCTVPEANPPSKAST